MWSQLLISIPMMVCFFWSIFFLIRFFRHEGEPRVKTSLLLFFIASTVLYTNHWFYFSHHQSAIGLYTYLLANLSVYPLYYAYLRALTRSKRGWEVPVLLIPVVLVAVLYPFTTPFGEFGENGILTITRTCFALQVIWVWIRGFQLLRDTCRIMDNTYSDDRSRLLQPMRVLQHLLGIIAFFSSVLNIMGREFFAHEAPVAVPAIVMSALLFSLGFIASHTLVPQETVVPEEKEEEERARRATTAETDELFLKITTALREQQLFTNPDLTIQDVAIAVNSNRTYISNCINRCTGYSFSQYVARYRVEHAQQVLVDPQYTSDHEAITHAIALSGFTSDQTFYRIFRDLTGVTPLQYRQKNR